MFVCQDCGRSHKGGFTYRGVVLENCPACGGVLDNDAPDSTPLELQLHINPDLLLEDWARAVFVAPVEPSIPEEEENCQDYMEEMVLSSCDRWNKDGERGDSKTLYTYLEPSWKRAWQMQSRGRQTVGWGS